MPRHVSTTTFCCIATSGVEADRTETHTWGRSFGRAWRLFVGRRKPAFTGQLPRSLTITSDCSSTCTSLQKSDHTDVASGLAAHDLTHTGQVYDDSDNRHSLNLQLQISPMALVQVQGVLEQCKIVGPLSPTGGAVGEQKARLKPACRIKCTTTSLTAACLSGPQKLHATRARSWSLKEQHATCHVEDATNLPRT